MIGYISFEYELKNVSICMFSVCCLFFMFNMFEIYVNHTSTKCWTCIKLSHMYKNDKKTKQVHKLCSTCLIYLYWEIVWQHLCLWLQEVHNVLSQVSLGSISLGPSTLLKVKGKQGKVIYRGRLLKTKQIKQYCIFL